MTREQRTRSRTDHAKVNKAREMARRRQQRLRDDLAAFYCFLWET